MIEIRYVPAAPGDSTVLTVKPANGDPVTILPGSAASIEPDRAPLSIEIAKAPAV